MEIPSSFSIRLFCINFPSFFFRSVQDSGIGVWARAGIVVGHHNWAGRMIESSTGFRYWLENPTSSWLNHLAFNDLCSDWSLVVVNTCLHKLEFFTLIHKQMVHCRNCICSLFNSFRFARIFLGNVLVIVQWQEFG